MSTVLHPRRQATQFLLKTKSRYGLPVYATVAEAITAHKADEPLFCVFPRVLERTAQNFLRLFPGRVMYAVKCNPHPVFLRTLYAAGIRDFDVASRRELQAVRKLGSKARAHFMHPVKARAAIREAYADGVRSFVVDSLDELSKILAETDMATDLTLMVRLSQPGDSASYSLAGKFGTQGVEAATLLRRARTVAAKLGVCFHVGSQCMHPSAFDRALQNVRELKDRAGVSLDIVDVGGGFPVAYPGMTPPSLGAYMAVIESAIKRAGFQDVELWCEPGRAMVAEAGSTIARVELRRGNDLYLNDGTYGSLFDGGVPGWRFPMQRVGDRSDATAETASFRLFGPTCDSIDVQQHAAILPSDIREGDWIEFGQLGAYGMALQTRFNGFQSDALAVILEEPLVRRTQPGHH